MIIPRATGYTGSAWREPVKKTMAYYRPGQQALYAGKTPLHFGTTPVAPAVAVHAGSYPYGYTGTAWKEPVGKTGSTASYNTGRKATYTVVPGNTKAKTTAQAGGQGAQFNLGDIMQRYMGMMLSPKEQATQAGQGVNDQIKLALANLNNNYASDKAMYGQQQERASGFALAMANLAGQDQKQILDEYTAAGNNVAGLGGMLTGAVGQAEQAGADQAQGQIAALTQGRNNATTLDVPGMQNVARYTGVVQPASDLYSQAESASAGARFDRLADAEKIHQIATDFGQKIQTAKQELDRNAATLEATRPGLYREALNTLQTNARSDFATILQAATLQSTLAQTPGKIANTAADTSGKKATTTSTIVGTKIDTAKSAGKTVTGQPGPGNYFVGTGKNAVAQPIPPHQKLDPKDPTYQTTIPDPNNPPTGQHYDQKKGKFVENKRTSTAAATAAEKNNPYQKDGKTLKPNWWQPAPGATPQPIPSGFYPDPKNPHHLIDLTPPRKPGVKGPKASDIKIYSTEVANALSTKNGGGKGYLKPDPSQSPVDAAANGKRYIPKIPTAQARAQLIGLYPPEMRKLPQVIAYVNSQLSAAGFK